LWSNHRGALWFEEDVPVVWGWRLWGFGARGFDPNPHCAYWPHLSVYVWFVLQALQYAAGRLTGTYAGAADFRAAAQLDPALLRGPAMLLATAVGLATIVATATLARRLAGAWGAAIVALVLAIDGLFLRYSLAVSPDMLLTLFSVLGLIACLDVAEHGRLRDSLLGGLWLGLGAACKYTPALLALPLLLAHAWRPGGRRGLRVLGDSRLWLAAAVALVAFAATTPFTIADLASRWSQVRTGADVLVHAPGGGARHYAIAEFVTRTLPDDLGWPLLALVAIAAVAALVRSERRLLLLLAYGLLVLALFGLVPTAFARYLLPAYPPLLVVLAATCAAAFAQRRARGVAIVVTAIALGCFAIRAVATVREYRLPDTRAIAREWFVAHVPDGATVELESLGPELPERASLVQLARTPTSARWHKALLAGPAYYVSPQPMSFPDPELAMPFYAPLASVGYDRVVTSGGVKERYLADPVRFPLPYAFYAAMDRFVPCEWRSPDAGCTGPPIAVYRLDAASRAALERWSAALAADFATAMPDTLGPYQARLFTQRASVLAAGGATRAAEAAWREALRWPPAPGRWWRTAAATATLARDSATAAAWTREAARRDATR
jgi:hypothetical protein